MMMTVVAVCLLTLAGSVPLVHANTCENKAPSWRCDEGLPFATATFKQAVVEQCGNKISKTKFDDVLGVKFPGADLKAKYTLVMVDPDAPGSRPGEAWLHWILSGLEGTDLAQGTLTTGTTVMNYTKPTPPNGTGVHRYLIYVYQDPAGEGQNHPDPPQVRRRFNLQQYAKSLSLCGPKAHNMFEAEF